jgi:predicted PurR-regulated permease PerM
MTTGRSGADAGGTTVPRWARILLSLAAVVIIVAGLRAASAIVMPFFIAVFVAVIASGPLFWLEKRGLPTALAVVLIVAGILGLGVGLGAIAGTSVNEFTERLPEYQSRLEGLRDEAIGWLHARGLTVPEDSLKAIIDPRAAMALTANLLKGVGSLLANFLLILLTVVFLLLEIAAFTRKLKVAFGDPDAPHGGIDRFADSVRRYVAIKTVVSLATGVLVWLWLVILGVDFPLLWGLLAFLLNYVPNIGSIIAALPPIMLALIQFGIVRAVLVATGYIVVNLGIGSILEPRFMGRGLGLSPLVVFVSLVFWGWVFGPVGMLLSVLLTVTLKIALESVEETRWLAVLMGGEAVTAVGAPVGAATLGPLEASGRPGDGGGGDDG